MPPARRADKADSGKGANEVANIAQAAASEALAGLVERVTFHNPENGFCVLRVKARGHRDLVTVVGRAALISAGEFIQMSGTWVNDRTHGQQFRASFLKTSPPTTLEGIERYLASGMIRGIGPVYAKRLVRASARRCSISSSSSLTACVRCPVSAPNVPPGSSPAGQNRRSFGRSCCSCMPTASVPRGRCGFTRHMAAMPFG